MKATDVIAVTYDADVHCLKCADKRFPGISGMLDYSDLVDSEENQPHPIFYGDETAEEERCGDCFCNCIENAF